MARTGKVREGETEGEEGEAEEEEEAAEAEAAEGEAWSPWEGDERAGHADGLTVTSIVTAVSSSASDTSVEGEGAVSEERLWREAGDAGGEHNGAALAEAETLPQPPM